MVRGLASLGCVIALVAACGGGGDATSGAGPTGSGGMSTHAGSGGAMGSGGEGGASASSTSGSGGASVADASHGGTGGGATNEAGSEVGATTDAPTEPTPGDARIDVTPPSQCLGAHEACGVDAGTCCEAYVCRLGKCCVPTGIRSNCIANTDCCSNSCVLNQCTCVPLGYSCTGPGQCCGGFSCENGTCICPPDIRGCP